MNISFQNCVIFVENIENAKEFYINFLNQEIKFDFGENIVFTSGISLWQLTDSLEITKKLEGKFLKNNTNNFELYFETDEIETIFKKLKDFNVKFLHEIQEETWGQKNFRFFDLDNHLIEVGENMSIFIKRFFKQGMTPEEISKRTSVDLYTINKIINE